MVSEARSNLRPDGMSVKRSCPVRPICNGSSRTGHQSVSRFTRNVPAIWPALFAAVLAGREPGRDPGAIGLLRRYERGRAEPILAMDSVVDGLFSFFAGAHPLTFRLRNAGLNLADRLAVLKNVLVRHAMN